MDIETLPKPSKSILSPAQRQAALLLAKGCTQAETARTIGRTKWTVGQWLRCNPRFQTEVDRLLDVSRRQILERLPVLTELALDALEQALRIPYASGARLETARHIIDRLLALSTHLPGRDGAELINAELNPAPIEKEAEVAKEEIAQVRTLERPSAEQIQAVLQRAKAAVARSRLAFFFAGRRERAFSNVIGFTSPNNNRDIASSRTFASTLTANVFFGVCVEPKYFRPWI